MRQAVPIFWDILQYSTITFRVCAQNHTKRIETLFYNDGMPSYKFITAFRGPLHHL